ncbi:hypothetical protein LOK49_LG10G00816 [Camellia lanceoleosa]|uniref:Uncharacterized protein n=1 Tax=Camellia lanceoleosa TaxID=1840588 RepID=A0ACC0GD65_9ERIC|nr:hypothetical protein LOK49_LG10G00816 [Camellia lanceoleosa]
MRQETCINKAFNHSPEIPVAKNTCFPPLPQPTNAALLQLTQHCCICYPNLRAAGPPFRCRPQQPTEPKRQQSLYSSIVHHRELHLLSVAHLHQNRAKPPNISPSASQQQDSINSASAPNLIRKQQPHNAKLMPKLAARQTPQ